MDTAARAARRRVRRVRGALLGLLLLSGGLAGVLLFLQYQLADLRARVRGQLEAQLGLALHADEVEINGLRGLRIDNLRLDLRRETGPAIQLTAPAAYLDVDLAELAAARLAIDRVRLDGAVLTLTRPLDGAWLPASGGGGGAGLALPPGVSFRVTGRGCRLRLVNVIGEQRLDLAALDFDLSRLPDAADVHARIVTAFAGDPAKPIEAHVRFASPEDFDLRASGEGITAPEVNAFLPEPQRLAASGAAGARLRATGYPGGRLVVSLDASFENLALRDQPAFLEPASGALTALADYDAATRRLTLRSARIDSAQLAGAAEGSVAFEGEAPTLDLRAEAHRIPVDELLAGAMPAAAGFGTIEAALDGPYGVAVRIQGTTAAPLFAVEASLTGGTVRFAPKSAGLPSGELEIGAVQLHYAPGSALPSGTLHVTGGRLAHKGTGLEVEGIAGAVQLDDAGVTIDPIHARLGGDAIVGRLRYDLAKAQAEFALDGTLSNLEKTPLGSGIPDVWTEGALSLRAAGTVARDHFDIDVDADATRMRFDLEWWLRKPMGMGAVLKQVNVAMDAKKRLSVTGTVEIDAQPVRLALEVGPSKKGGMRTESIRVSADAIDVTALGKCLRIPYTATGGTVTNATVDWRRAGDPEKGKIVEIGLDIDDIALLAHGTQTPLRCRAARADVVLDDSNPAALRGTLTLRAEEAHIPPFDVKWLLPLEPETEDLKTLYKGDPRTFTFDLGAARVSLPPWEGTDFTATVVDAPGTTTIDPYRATVAGGTLEGAYAVQTGDNTGALYAKWTEVPAVYLLRHLELPEILTGTATGEFRYTTDEDDPSTMQGQGSFAIRDGKFSADAITSEIASRAKGTSFQLPSSLAFSRFGANVAIAGDTVTTTGVALESEGITVSGEGSFVTSGDLDYRIEVGVAPATAAEIPVLRNSFNLEGNRLTQRDIQLAFHIVGPLINPDIELTGLPGVGETLVSGAAAVTTETIRIIDVPRQILLDLFRIGGGILGQTRQQRNP